MAKLLSSLIILLLVLLATSVVFNYLLYKKASLPLYATKQDPLELRYYPEAAQPLTNGKPVFLLYGGSRRMSRGISI
ncbi:MAG: hypothetical protein CSB47_05010 [Proteobacteria bacterium]|nr:MAG: hypothetical protein CSB47_05010 [Pseudomonadota bacterium]